MVPAAMTATRFGCGPLTAPAASAPPSSIVTSDGMGMHADSAAMSSRIAVRP